MDQLYDTEPGQPRVPLRATADGYLLVQVVGGGGGGGSSVTNLSTTVSPTSVVVASDTGTDATIPVASTTDAGVMPPEAVVQLAGLGTASTAAAGDFASAGHTHALLMTTDERTKLGALPVAADLATSLAGKMANTLPAVSTAFNAGTAPEKAAFQAAVSGDGAPDKILAKLQRARLHSTRIVMPSPPVVTTSTTSFSGFTIGFPSVTTSNAAWTGIADFWGGFMARATNRIKPRVATATPGTATDPLAITGFDDGGSGVSFHIDADVFVLFLNASNLNPVRIAVDELDGNGPRLISLAGTVPAQTSDWYAKLDFTSAGGAKERVIHIEGGQSWAFSRVFVATGSLYKVWSPASADVPHFSILHDSYGFGPVSGQYTTPTPITQDGYAMELVRMLGYRCDIYNASIGGSGLGVQGGGGKTTFEGRWFDLLNRLPDGVAKRGPWEPEFCVIPGSINNNATADATLLTSLDAIYNNIRAVKLTLPLIFTGPVIRPNDSGVGAAVGNNELYRTWVAGKIAAGDRRIAFVSVSSADEKWFDGTGYLGAATGNGINDKMIGTDGAHPSYDGHPYFARRLFSGICAALASMS